MTDPEFRALREVLRDVDRSDLELLCANLYDTLGKAVSAMGAALVVSPVTESMTREDTARMNELVLDVATRVEAIVRRRN